MMSGRAGARVVRSKVSRKHKSYLAALIMLLTCFFGVSSFSLPSEAAYRNLTSTTTVTVEDVTYFFPEALTYITNSDGESVGVAGYYCDITLRYNMSFSGTYYYDTPYELLGRLFANVNVNFPIGLPQQHNAWAEVVNTWSQDYISGDFDTMVGAVTYNFNQGLYTFRTYTSFRKDSAGGTGNSAPIYYQKIRLHFTTNAKHLLSTVYGQPYTTATGCSASVVTQAFRIVEKADMIPFASENNQLLQGMNSNIISILAYTTSINSNVAAIKNAIADNTVAAAAMDEANVDFVNAAASLEAGQSNLENAADASLAAVDFNQVNIIDTYSQSVSFWLQLVNQLPSMLGALWSVLIFGFVLAFVLFIVRLRR